MLSKMSGAQASELKELEVKYEEALDENCRNLAEHFMEVLKDEEMNGLMNPPPVILRNGGKSRAVEYEREQRIETEQLGAFKNGRYNNVNIFLFYYYYFLIYCFPHLFQIVDCYMLIISQRVIF